mmetsp:Transcript_38160/g.109510  ORF Transcript_38160/g.109510 Transcript_38160/m.109510 type:complete len:228 (-) Transcript_38160:438-1121(-)
MMIVHLRGQLVEERLAHLDQCFSRLLPGPSLVLLLEPVFLKHALANDSSQYGNHAETSEDDPNYEENSHAWPLINDPFILLQIRGGHHLEQSQHRLHDGSKLIVQELCLGIFRAYVSNSPHQENRGNVENEDHKNSYPNHCNRCHCESECKHVDLLQELHDSEDTQNAHYSDDTENHGEATDPATAKQCTHAEIDSAEENNQKIECIPAKVHALQIEVAPRAHHDNL